MVGAGVLILALVIVGPMVLDGGSGSDAVEDAVPGQPSEELLTQTFRLNHASPVGQATGDSGSIASPAAPRADPHPQSGTAQQQTAPAPAATAGIVQPQPSPAAAPPTKPEKAPDYQAYAVAAVRPQVESQPASQVAPRPDGTPGGGWLVQVGTFGQKDNAERLAASLRQRGFAAFVSPMARTGRTLYRVRVGPSGSREAAAGVAGKLATAGQSGQIVAQ